MNDNEYDGEMLYAFLAKIHDFYDKAMPACDELLKAGFVVSGSVQRIDGVKEIRVELAGVSAILPAPARFTVGMEVKAIDRFMRLFLAQSMPKLTMKGEIFVNTSTVRRHGSNYVQLVYISMHQGDDLGLADDEADFAGDASFGITPTDTAHVVKH